MRSPKKGPLSAQFTLSSRSPNDLSFLLIGLTSQTFRPIFLPLIKCLFFQCPSAHAYLKADCGGPQNGTLDHGGGYDIGCAA
jgi:hypothetical protein